MSKNFGTTHAVRPSEKYDVLSGGGGFVGAKASLNVTLDDRVIVEEVAPDFNHACEDAMVVGITRGSPKRCVRCHDSLTITASGGLTKIMLESSCKVILKDRPLALVERFLHKMSRVWGYLLDDTALVQYGLDHGLGTIDTPNARENTLFRAGADLLTRADIAGHARFTGAYNKKGNFVTYFALACDDPFEWLPKPDRDLIDALKEPLKFALCSEQSLGYLLDDAALIQYGLMHGFGTVDTPVNREDTLYRAGSDLLCRADVVGHVRFTGAYKGKFVTCFALG
ncbi:hypothetical protein DXG01_010293 [Tephrocybe rancida]|nr:hypothetical protein DXG01_010293 [Tephrocybe rancida]